MSELKDEDVIYGANYRVKSRKVVTHKVRPCPFCHKTPTEITKIGCRMLFKDGSVEESRSVKCECGVHGPTRDSAINAVVAWNGIE